LLLLLKTSSVLIAGCEIIALTLLLTFERDDDDDDKPRTIR